MVEGHPQKRALELFLAPSKALRQHTALTIVEVMVALGLITMALMLVLSLIPAGIRASRQAQATRLALSWSMQLIEETRMPERLPLPKKLAQSSFEQKLQGIDFKATRTVNIIGPFLYKIEVRTSWPGANRPLTIALTRFNSEAGWDVKVR